MADALVNLAVPAWQLVVRTVVIYLVLLFALRIIGKREIGQFTVFDLVLILLVANAVQPAMTGPDSSLVGGLLIIATLMFVNWGIAQMRRRVPFLRNVFEGEATVIGENGHWLSDVMERERVDLQEGEMALREHGVARIEDASLVVLEADGTISVVAKSEDEAGMRRRRFRRKME